MLQKVFAGMIMVSLILSIIFNMGTDIENQAASANFSNATTQSMAESTGWIVPTIMIAAVILGVIGYLKVGRKGKGSLLAIVPFMMPLYGSMLVVGRAASKIKKWITEKNGGD